MSNLEAPGRTGEGDRPDQDRTTTPPDPPNPFGPDAPNIREDDPAGGPVVPEAAPPTPPEAPLDEDNFAPDEA